MAKREIVHNYFRKDFGEMIILVQVNPITYQGMELTITRQGTSKRKLNFDEAIEDDLAADGFTPSGALEFNLYLKGLRGE